MSSQALREKLRIILLSSLGGGLEFYDFVIFAIFAKSIGENFFPASSALATQINSYAVFAVGYLIRPVGGVIFSHFGDKYGRKNSFAFSISLMAGATLCMSVLPNYNQLGIFATLLFVLLRLLQGLSIGGEIPGALTFVSEHMPLNKGMACAGVLVFLNAGILVGDLVNLFLHWLMPVDLFIYYGWRIAFMLGGMLAIISFYMRRQLSETQGFLELNNKHPLPILALFQSHAMQVIKAIFIVSGSAVPVIIFLLFINSYLQNTLNIAGSKASQLNLLQLFVFMIASAAASIFSDRVDRRKMLALGACYLIISPYFIFSWMSAKQIDLSLLIAFNAIGIGLYAGVMPCFLTELFPINVRFSGVAVSYNLAFAVFGGLSPLLSTYLIRYLNSPIAPAYLIMASGLLALVGLSFQNGRRVKLVVANA